MPSTDRQLETLEALRARYKDAPPDSVFTVGVCNPDETGFRSVAYRVDQVERCAEDYGGRSDLHVWSRISVLPPDYQPVKGSRGLESQTLGTCNLHVDLDPDGTTNWLELKLEELRTFQYPPTRIEFSGRGLYAFWNIGWTTDWQKVKRANKWLEEQLGGDHCYDVARILRLPGTKNVKADGDWARTIETDGPTYSLTDFPESLLDKAEERQQEAEYEPDPLELGIEYRIAKANKKLWSRIESEASARDVGAKLTQDRKRVDRSSNDLVIAMGCLRLGLTPNEVYSVLTHERWFSGEKYRTCGHHDSYVIRTIDHALQSVPQAEITNMTEVSQIIQDSENVMYYLNDWWRYNPDKGVYDPGDNYLKNLVQGLSGSKWTPGLETGSLQHLKTNVLIDNPLLIPDTSHLVNVRNGMLNWDKGTLEDHRPGWRSLGQVDALWDPLVDTGEVDAFVKKVIPDDSIHLWWMFAGYTLSEEAPDRCLFALVGPARTGKSTILQAQQLFIGNQNCSAVSLTDLAGGGSQFTSSALVGKMLNLDTDAPYDQPIRDNSLLKKLATGEPIMIEKKGHDPVTMALPIKLAFAMNGMPATNTPESAFFSRWVIIPVRSDRKPFEINNPETVREAHKKLLSSARNRSAWLLRSVEGRRQLQQEGGFRASESVERASQEMMETSDAVYSFWRQKSEPNPDTAMKPLSLMVAYHMYVAYAKDIGQREISYRRFLNRSRELAKGNPELSLNLIATDPWTFTGRSLKTTTITIKPATRAESN